MSMSYKKDILGCFSYEFEPSHKSRRKPCISSATCCGISSIRSIVYHQAAGNARWRVMRYKGGLPPLMIYTTLRAAMICQACGLDKKSRILLIRLFCLWATKKIFVAVYLRLTAHKKTFSYLVPFAFLMPFQMLSQYERQFLFQ